MGKACFLAKNRDGTGCLFDWSGKANGSAGGLSKKSLAQGALTKNDQQPSLVGLKICGTWVWLKTRPSFLKPFYASFCLSLCCVWNCLFCPPARIKICGLMLSWSDWAKIPVAWAEIRVELRPTLTLENKIMRRQVSPICMKFWRNSVFI